MAQVISIFRFGRRRCVKSLYEGMPYRQLSLKYSAIANDAYDILIAGGGMVGSALACRIASSDVLKGTRVKLLEGSKKPANDFSSNILNPSRLSRSNRVVAVSPRSEKLFENIGIWETICNSAKAWSVREMNIWDSCSTSSIGFASRDSALAHIVENDVIVASLHSKLAELGGLSLDYDCFVVDATRHGDTSSPNSLLQVTTRSRDTGETNALHTRLLIAADGFKSSAREMARIKTLEWSYGQDAVVGTLHINMPSEGTSGKRNNAAWQRFTPYGPIALLPLDNTRCSLIWTVPSDDKSDVNSKYLMSLTDEQFVDQLNSSLIGDNHYHKLTNAAISQMESIVRGMRNVLGLGNTLRVRRRDHSESVPTILRLEEGSRAKFPLSCLHANHYVKHNFVLVGDSAHRLHPLAGQGVNLGFGDVFDLANILEENILSGRRLDDDDSLLQYETQRQRDVLPVLAVVDSLNRLYSNQLSPLVFLRGIGLQAVNMVQPLKDIIVSEATS